MSQHLSILESLKKKNFKPVYWLQGEEPFFIDQIIDYAEHHLLDASEAAFNLTVFYGKDALWTDVVNACKKHPMFGSYQVVILKEAQMMKDIMQLENYILQPLNTTIFFVAYKSKSPDKRTSFAKSIQKSAELINSEKIRDEKIQPWIIDLVKLKNLTISNKAAALMAEHIGNDLSRIATELEKLTINLQNKSSIDEDDIEKNIGISKEYNVFELQAAIAQKNMSSAIKIIQYFEGNPKSAPIQMVLPALYGFFSKVYSCYSLQKITEQELKPLFFFNPNAVAQAQLAMKNYGYAGIERIILLLHHYNLKGVGIGDSGTESAALIKEMTVKMMI